MPTQSPKGKVPHTPHTLTPLSQEIDIYRDRGCETGCEQGVRQIVLEDLPAPYITPESVAARYRPAEAPDASPEPEAPRRRPLQRDPLVLLENEGVITRKQLDAGREILRVFTAITAAVAPRIVAAYGERVAKGIGEDLPVHLRLAYANRYAPWRDWAGAQAATPRSSLADLTLLVCVDGLGPRQVADRLRMDHRSVKRRLQASLHEYCRLAGWLAPSELNP